MLHVDALYKINKQLLPALVDSSKPFVLDLDTTVETVHGTQEGSSRGYNHRYPSRHSYQPFLAFKGLVLQKTHCRNGPLRDPG